MRRSSLRALSPARPRIEDWTTPTCRSDREVLPLAAPDALRSPALRGA